MAAAGGPEGIAALVGQETAFSIAEEVSKATIRRFAMAVGDLNPLFVDEEVARKSKYGGMVAPPTYIFAVNHDALAEVGEDGRLSARIKLPPPLTRIIRGGNEYEFFQPVRPGDRINGKRKITEIYEKEGSRRGRMVFVHYETTYTNQKNELLGINREILIFSK